MPIAGQPDCEVVGYGSVAEALAAGEDVDLLICDAPAGASRQTLELAEASDLVVQPTGRAPTTCGRPSSFSMSS